MLAHAFGFESAGDYGRANEATLPRLRAQAARAARRRARALAKVNALVKVATDSPSPAPRRFPSSKRRRNVCWKCWVRCGGCWIHRSGDCSS